MSLKLRQKTQENCLKFLVLWRKSWIKSRTNKSKKIFLLEVTIARKVLPHPQGIKGSIRNLLNKGLFSLYDPALQGRDVRRDDFDVLKYVTVHDSAKNFIIF